MTRSASPTGELKKNDFASVPTVPTAPRNYRPSVRATSSNDTAARLLTPRPRPLGIRDALKDGRPQTMISRADIFFFNSRASNWDTATRRLFSRRKPRAAREEDFERRYGGNINTPVLDLYSPSFLAR